MMTNREIKRLKRKHRSYSFADQKKGENIILVLRRHWITFVFSFLPFIAGAIALVIIHFVATEWFRDWGMEDNMAVLWFVESLVAMFLWLGAFINWIDYYFDAWIVTDQRIIDIEQLGLFRRNVSELDLRKIQDLTTEIHGILPTFLNYGYLYIQTAGQKERFIFKDIPDPMTVRELIVELHKRLLSHHRSY